MFNRLKIWWKTASKGEKILTTLNLLGIGTSIGCAIHCAKKTEEAFDHMAIFIAMQAPTECFKEDKIPEEVRVAVIAPTGEQRQILELNKPDPEEVPAEENTEEVIE